MKPEHTTDNPDVSKLGSFQSIDMEKDWARVSTRIGFDKIHSYRKRRLARTWRAAATIIVILGIGYLTRAILFLTGNNDCSPGRR